jgi:hypothetical protein
MPIVGMVAKAWFGVADSPFEVGDVSSLLVDYWSFAPMAPRWSGGRACEEKDG